MKAAVAGVAVALVVSSCAGGSEHHEPRFPQGQGWVVDHEQSSDLFYDRDKDAITSGSVEVLLADGVSAVITAETDLQSICTELLPPPAEAGPCWLQVGPPTEAGHAEWAVAFGLIGDSPGSETIHRDHSSYGAANAASGEVVEVADNWIVFSSGRVVARGPADPTFEPAPLVHGRMSECPVDSISALAVLGDTSVRFNAIVDVDTGHLITMQCWERI